MWALFIWVVQNNWTKPISDKLFLWRHHCTWLRGYHSIRTGYKGPPYHRKSVRHIHGIQWLTRLPRLQRMREMSIGARFVAPQWAECWVTSLRGVIIGSLSTRTGDHDGNVSETIKLIAEDKRSTWICEIDMISGSSCLTCDFKCFTFRLLTGRERHFWEITTVALSCLETMKQ